MYFAQHYLDCLSQASYLIGDTTTGRAIIVDPRRDIDDYLDDAAANGLRIEGVINTHFHADFLSGHLEMAAATGAWIGYGPGAETDFASRNLAEGEVLDLGGADGVRLEIMHTPGHTPESISIKVYEKATDAIPYGVLTGDALFIGDVGRPDLLASFGVTADELAAMLYDSVHNKLMRLPDQVRVFPAHGAGSACGKNLSTELQSTIGDQRATNYACQPMDAERFRQLVTAGQVPAPNYFAYDAMLNRQERALFNPADLPQVSLEDAVAAAAQGATVLDVREADEFTRGHLVGSLSVPLDGRFAETAGMFLDPAADIIVVTADDDPSEAITRLARVGFDKVVGYVAQIEQQLITADPALVAKASRLTQTVFARVQRSEPNLLILDVRNEGEVEDGMIPGSTNIPLAQLPQRLAEVPQDRPLVLNCAGGWRSAVAASYLRAHGFTDVSDLLGGFEGWQLLAGAEL